MKNTRRLGFRILIATLCALIAVAIILRIAFGWYLGSEGFHRKISLLTARALHAEGEFSPQHFSGATVYADQFSAHGNSDAFFGTLNADQIRGQLNWRGLLHRKWEIDELSAQRVAIQLANHEQPVVRPGGAPTKPPRTFTLDLRKAIVQESDWTWGEGATAGSLKGSALVLTPNESSWLITVAGGKLSQNNWPALDLENAKMRTTSDTLFVSESTLRSGAGRVRVTGEVQFNRAADLQAEIEKLGLTPLLPNDWRARLSGNFSGSIKIHAPLADASKIQLQGTITISDGQVEALPLLNQIALFTGSERFRRLAITHGSLDFTRGDGAMNATNVVLEAEGLMRMEGAFTIRDERLDGNFQLGVTAGSLQWLPGSRERVFTTERGGYFWTPLHVAGPIAHPKEDLSLRLITAAAGQLLDDPAKAAKSILDLLPR